MTPGARLGAALAGALLAACAVLPGRAPARDEWAAEVPAATARTWLGPALYACRLQDWALDDGAIRCLAGAPGTPIRVAHALDVTLDAAPAAFELEVVLELGAGGGQRESCGGFLVGAGGEDVPYALTALCHTRPAADGGLAVGVEPSGRVVFRDNETNRSGGTWSVSGALQAGEFEELAADERADPPAGARAPRRVHLVLRGAPQGDAYALVAESRDADTGAPLGRAVRCGVAPDLVEGGLALFSHLAPDGTGAGWSFRAWRARGPKLARHPERTFGPVLTAQYTVSGGVLKLTAQLPPLGADDAREGTLEVRTADGWRTVAYAGLDPDAYTLRFRVPAWDAARATPYRVVYDLRTGPDTTRRTTFEGLVRAEPGPDDPLVLAAFTGNKHFTGGLAWNSSGVWFPHLDIVAHVAAQDPDLLFFSGDQIYEGDLTGAQRAPDDQARLDYLDKWFRWCWAFRDLVRERPTVTLPDDHDVYHGNLWGAGGRHADRQDDGGYTMPARFVRMVERTQTSHLPDPYDPTPVEQGIGVYYTSLDWGGVSFAVLEDRKWKSSATPLVPAGECVNGWFQADGFDAAKDSDVPGAVLLGERQLAFLEHWAGAWSADTWMKCALSQTIFADVATLPAGAKSGAVLPSLGIRAPDDPLPQEVRAADCDSNGWPRSGRDRALRELRKAYAFHVAGDQHLATFVRYGVERFDDAGFAFCVPSIANTWPRRWFPAEEGLDRAPGAPPYTGCFHDGFGNKVRVLAVANPVRTGVEPTALHDRQPGYGIVRFDKRAREIDVECWPRWVDPTAPDARCYAGWPQRVAPLARVAGDLSLGRVELNGLTDPVARLWRGAGAERELVRAWRPRGASFEPLVGEPGAYTLELSAPDGTTQRLDGLVAPAVPGAVHRVDF